MRVSLLRVATPSTTLAFAAASRLAIISLISSIRPLNLLVRHLLNASAVLDFHVPRHQQDKQFQKYRGLVPHHLLYRLAAAATEGKMHLADCVGVQRMTRAMDVAAKVSRHPPV